MVLDAFDRMESEPDQIDMMSEEELREELRRIVSPKIPNSDSMRCDCRSSSIRWVDGSRPHPAIDREGWFCMGCLTQYVPAKMLGHTLDNLYDEQQAHGKTKGKAFQMERALQRLVTAESTGNHGQDLACMREIARMGLSLHNTPAQPPQVG